MKQLKNVGLNYKRIRKFCLHCGEEITDRKGRALYHLSKPDCHAAHLERMRQKNRTARQKRRLASQEPLKPRKKNTGAYRCLSCGKRLPEGYHYRHDHCLDKIQTRTDENYIYANLEM